MAPVRWTRLPGKRALFEQLLADRVLSIFGNPGTTEQPFMDVLADYPDVTYYLALHEGVAIAMADAYGRATRKAALVELHIAPGLGNAMGALYNAHVGKSPMVCYVGQSPTSGLFQEPYLSGDLVSLARPFSKWAAEISTAADIPHALRRAFKTAEEPPQGPVVLSIPMDALDEEANVLIEPTRHVEWRTSPPAGAVEEAADLLTRAENPALAIGDQVGLCDGADSVVELAELLGAPIINAFSNQVNAPSSHPLYQSRGGIPLTSGAVRERLSGYDLVVAVGTPLFSSILPDIEGPIPQGTKVIHVDLDSWELGKNQGGELLIKADPGATCQAIAEELRRRVDDAVRGLWQQRRSRIQTETVERREQLIAKHRRESWDAVPITGARLMAELADAVTPDAAIFDESITSGRAFETYLQPDQPWQRFRARGGGIGGGLPGAIGLKVAFPDRPVVGVIADGSSLFSITGLWTAAHHRLPVAFVVCNNRSYEVLKRNMKQYRGGREDAPYPFMDLTDPEIRFDLIAESFGVAGRRVEHPDELGKALTEAIDSDEPALLDVIVG